MSKLAVIPILIFLLLIFNKKYENYNPEIKIPVFLKPSVKILSLEQVHKFIEEDDDNFIASLTVFDLRARKCSSYIEYKNKSIESIKYILSNKIVNKIVSICEIADNILQNSYPEIFNINWNIALFSNKIYEGGYPHTREDIIFIPFELLLDADVNTLVKTFIHEKIHILQRMYPASNTLQEYLKANNFSKFQSLDKFREFNTRTRSNPDLDNWIYTDGIKFFYCEYSSDFPKSIMDVIQSNEIEHPFETMAYNISNELVKQL